jgi:hypothetical protein
VHYAFNDILLIKKNTDFHRQPRFRPSYASIFILKDGVLPGVEARNQIKFSNNIYGNLLYSITIFL